MYFGFDHTLEVIKNTAAIEKCLSLIQLFSLYKKDILSYITKKRILLKNGGGGGGRFRVKRGVFFSSKIREKGVFCKLGLEHGIRFGRERDAGDGVSEGEFIRALLLTQITNHMPGEVWD